ncbi:DUF5723 family protein [Flagellimonas sp.]|uniref:DUF5723 family protein n=1 Tax=Flagellimonas sp. TaxID=2058762 RepID=UPI003F4A599D
MKWIKGLAFTSIIGIGLLNAQNKQLLYDFYEIPQSLMVNPGVKANEKWHVGIPALSGISFQGASSGVTVNDLFANDGIDFNVKVRERVINALSRRDDFSTTSQIEIFSVGFRGRNRPDDYYSFGMYGETDVIVYWPRDLAILAFEGNGGANIGRSFDLGHLNVRGEMVNVLHFGINRKVNSELTVGLRAKLYSGIFNFRSTNNTGTFRTSPGQQNILENSIDADLQLQTAGVDEFLDIIDQGSGTRTRDIQNLFTRRALFGGNLGLGFDAGFTYQLNPQTTITGSILDVGFIFNSKDIRNFTLEGSASNEGINVFLPEDVDNLGTDLWQELIDEIEAAIPFEENTNGYISFRPVKVYGSIRYDFGEGASKTSSIDCGCAINVFDGNTEQYYRNSIGAQLFLQKRPLGIQPALTGFYQRRLGRSLSLKAAYTMDKYSFSNVGLGLNLQAGPVNFYILGDNLLAYRNIADSQYASFQFGFNIISWNGN